MRLSINKKYKGNYFMERKDAADVYHPLLIAYAKADAVSREYKEKGIGIENLDAHRANYRAFRAKEAWEAAGCPIFKSEK